MDDGGGARSERGLARRARLRRTHIREDEQEFAALFEELYPTAYRVAFRLLGNTSAAEDAAAEAFARAFARWGEVGPLAYREAWILRVTTNIALTVLARHAPPPVELAVVEIEDLLATRAALVSALRALPERQREVITLRHLAGFSEAQVAEALDIAPGTVKTHLSRGLLALRRRVTSDGANPVAT